MAVRTLAVRTLAVRCADWPAVATGRPPEVPVAVVAANRVRSVSPAARAEGVVPGLRRREAQARCPTVEIHERDDAREARAFEPVLAALEELAPRIEVAEPGRCAVPTRGPSRYHGGDRALAALVLDRVRAALAGRFGGRVPCPVGVGVADGPRAAALAAREALSRPDGRPVVVPPGGTGEFLAPLPVTRLRGVGLDPDLPGGSGTGVEDLVDVLHRLGIRTLGRLAALPAPDVLARFGAPGLDAHRLASGREERPPNATEPPPDLRASAVLDPPADRVDGAVFTAKALADALDASLSARGLACTRVLVVLETADGERVERLWRHEGVLSAAAVAQRVRWQLDGWLTAGRSRGRGGVSRLELVPDEVVTAGGHQPGFWGGAAEADERARRAVARLQGLVGPGSVLVPEWQGGRAPSDRYRLVPADTVEPGERHRPGPEPWPGSLPAPSPAVVWPRPRPAEVLDAAGRRVGVSGRGLISAPPAHCSIDGGPEVPVRAWAGPWCADERWWDPVAHRRRARLQVVLAPTPAADRSALDTAHLLVLEAGSWWLEATYD